MCECDVCKRIVLTKQGKNPYFVRELETGYVVMGDYQRFKGYTLFLCKEHATELHFLEKEFRNKFLQEMALVAEATYKAFKPDKLNYELLGVGKGVHMHWHFFPRREGDTPMPGPVWKLDKEEMYHEKYIPTEEELEEMKKMMNAELDKLI
uniref:HIT family protein n=1 Tax=Acetatifactor sp. TaxID=1872090 RepID=UPI0040563515